MPLTMSGFSVNGFSYNPSISATAGATTTVSATKNVTITSFSPFSLVQFGIAPYTYYVSSGTLPTGVTIDSSTGVVSGTPTVTQSAANVVFSVKDSTNEVATTTSTVSFSVVGASYTVQYLIVAGGGGGSCSYSGGGGAGGVLTGSTTLTACVSYSVVVGSGGTALPGRYPGNPSYINGCGPVYISATGGGGGGGCGNAGPYPAGKPGGSGGGGGYPSTAGGPGTPGQGNPGGAGSGFGGGGGGGAGGPGSNGPGGPGGAGRPVSIGGITATYGGGGGGAQSPPGNGGNGGSGGGGNGGGPSRPGSAGSTNTGGGGGGQWFNGGSGIIIMAIPTPNYSGNAPGASVTTPPAAPGMTVLTYNSSGSYTG